MRAIFKCKQGESILGKMTLERSVDNTDYLKGLAITSVYINHFIGGYVNSSVNGYANGFISIFFLLSGYGVYHSLQGRICIDKGWCSGFYLKRLLRIYPLFWIWCLLNGFSNGILGFWGLDIINPKSPWFIPAIIQCYLLAPILYIFISKVRLRTGVAAILIGFVVLNVTLPQCIGEPIRAIGYRGLFFSHIFLFCLGYLLANFKFYKEIKGILLKNYFFATAIFLFFIQETSSQSIISFYGKEPIFNFIFLFSTLLICFVFISNPKILPLNRFFGVIGRYSYSIYLFHCIGFALVKNVGLIGKPVYSYFDIIIIIILSPILIFSYCFLEIIVNEVIFGKRDCGEVLLKAKVVILVLIFPFRGATCCRETTTGSPHS